MITNFFSPLSFVTVFGSGIRDPGSGMGKNQDPGSGINIPDPPHWFLSVVRSVMASGAVKLIIIKLVTNINGLSFKYVVLKLATDKVHRLCLSADKLKVVSNGTGGGV